MEFVGAFLCIGSERFAGGGILYIRVFAVTDWCEGKECIWRFRKNE